MWRKITLGDPIGTLGKEGASGGWSHLHFEIKSRQPSGKWGTMAAYAFAWEAYVRKYSPQLIAVARPHHVTWVGQPVTLEANRSWSAAGKIRRTDWMFVDGTTASGSTVERRYDNPGEYSEVVRVTDDRGNVDYDFAVVLVLDPEHPELTPPTIHPACSPTRDVGIGVPITFKVRSFGKSNGPESWDFGDGSPPVTVRSDGNADPHSPDGYAVTTHVYRHPGDYLVHVSCRNERSEAAHGHLLVRVRPIDE